MANRRQRKKNARKLLKTRGAFIPNNTFRSNLSIKSTLFNPNERRYRKLIMTAESNLNRISYIINEANNVNLINITEDDLKLLSSQSFLNQVTHLQQYLIFNKDYYKPEKYNKVENVIRYVTNKYFDKRNISSARSLDRSIRNLIKKLDAITKKYDKKGLKGANPFIIVFYEDLELR